MSSRGGGGRGRGGFRGGSDRGRGSGRGGRGGFQSFNAGPPDSVLEMGRYMHACEGEMVCKSTNSKVPYFNAPIYLENKSQIGKVDEILGPLNEVFFTVKLSDGFVATSFKAEDRVYIAPDKLLPLERFLPKPTTGPKRELPRLPIFSPCERAFPGSGQTDRIAGHGAEAGRARRARRFRRPGTRSRSWTRRLRH
ncbi:Gar1/Naf1 RNA binding region-domain-containing protein [Hyaloraphidium curvatum]|nr:Gar1/Naf1 RNA binding region-domain-containing protein [Hyaloraphidium curvatum]